MSAILKVKIPFFRRKTSGGSNGVATFYLGSVPAYLPTLNQVCVVTHTNVLAGSGLANKLAAISTNVVTGKFQSYDQLASTDTAAVTDNFQNFFVIAYDDQSFSINQFAGDCQGYIEYDVNPSTYQILKPVENVAVVNENVSFDNDTGYAEIFCISGATAPYTNTPAPIMPAMMVRLQDNNTIFANLMKSLNLPVIDSEMKKYTRSQLGTLTEVTGGPILIDGRNYQWTSITTNTPNAIPHPTTGHTGEYYGTVLQSVGSIDFPGDNSKTPVPNQVALMFEIPHSFYGEIIDGKSVKMTVPYWAATAGPDQFGVYTYGATETSVDIYGTYNKNGANLDLNMSEKDLSLSSLGARPDLSAVSDYESNVVLLFANEVKRPNGDGAKDWAGGHLNVLDGAKVFTTTAVNPKQPYSHQTDVCVGAVYLDKGFVVITHPQIVDSIFTKAFGGAITTVAGVKTYNFNSPATGDARGLIKTVAAQSNIIRTVNSSNQVEWENTQWVFNGTASTPMMEYLSYNSEKSLNVVCLASADEFYKSTNPTAKELLGVDDSVDFASFKSADANLNPVIITQIGIHDAQGNLLAVCKPAQPVKKYWYDVVSFNVKIRL